MDRASVVDYELILIELILTLLRGLLFTGRILQDEEAHASCRLVMDQDVEGLLLGQLIHSGFEPVEQVVVHVCAYFYFLQAHVPLMDGHNGIPVIVLLPGIVFLAQTYGYPGLAFGYSPPAIHNGLHQHLVGGVLLHAELTGYEVDGDALGKAYLYHIAAAVLYKFIFAHRHLGAALFYAGDIAVGIHVEDGAVGQKIAIQSAGSVIALDVVVQQILPGEGILRSEPDVCRIGYIAESSRLRYGDGIGSVYHSGLNAVQQVQVYIAFQRDHTLDNHRVGVLFYSVSVLVHYIEDDGDDIDIHIAYGLGIHPAVGPGEGVEVEVIILSTHGCRAFHHQLVGPDGIHAGAGGDVGNFFHCIQAAPPVAGPDEADRAFVVGDKAVHEDIAAAAGEHLYLGRIILDGLHIIAYAGDCGQDISLVSGVDGIEGDAPVGAVGDYHSGEHGLVVHLQSHFIAVVGVDEGPPLEVVGYIQENDVPGAGILIELDRLLHAHFPDQQSAVIVGHVDVDAGRRIAEVKDRAAVHKSIAGGIESMVVLSLFDYCSALPQGHIYAVAFKLIVGDTESCAAEYDAGANHGAVNSSGHAVSFCHSFAQGVELHGSTHVDIGLPVIRAGGGVDRGGIVAGDVCIQHVHLSSQVGVRRAGCVDICAQSRALGVHVDVHIELGDMGDDVHIPGLYNGLVSAGFTHLHVGSEIQCYRGAGLGSDAKAGGVHAGGALHAGLRGFGIDVHRIEAASYLCAGAHAGADIAVDIRFQRGVAHGHKAAGAYLGESDYGVLAAAGSQDVNISIIGCDAAAVVYGDVHGAVEHVFGSEVAAGNKSAAVGIGLRLHVRLGEGLNDRCLISIQQT